MIRRAYLMFFAALLVSLVLVLDALASGPRLSHARYQSMLTRADAQVSRVETAAEHGLTPKATLAQAKTLLLAWARTETRLGKSFRAVSPPSDAARANALLWQGEVMFGAELASAADHLPQKKAQVRSFLQQRLGTARGARKIDAALALLKKAGYGGG